MSPDAIIYAALIGLAPIQSRPAPPPQATILEVKVLDEQDQPVPEATVRVFTSPFKALLTDSTGVARVSDLKAGSYRVNAAKGGFRLAEQSVSVQNGQTATLEFHLQSDRPSPPKEGAPTGSR